jgi:hypothetical protein
LQRAGEPARNRPALESGMGGPLKFGVVAIGETTTP